MALDQDTELAAARAGNREAFDALAASYRRELRAHCYRMSGSLHDADDLLQDTLLRAWRGLASFEGRSSLRTWLYRVATSACLDAADRQRTRALPTWLAPRATSLEGLEPDRETPWLEPAPDALAGEGPVSPEARFSARESVSLAFLAALQRLPARQRAVLLLRDVLGLPAAECAELLDTTVASVNSALQRARDTLASHQARPPPEPEASDSATRSLLARYVRAWEEADVQGLMTILHEEAVLAMPPYAAWFRGPADIGAVLGARVLPPGARGVFRLVPTRANGEPAFGVYARDGQRGTHRAQALHVVCLRGERVGEIHAFLEPRHLGAFGLAETLA